MATTDPFERPGTLYRVLVNSAGQYSLWPAGVVRPEGWNVSHGPADREECLQWIDGRWALLMLRAQNEGGRGHERHHR